MNKYLALFLVTAVLLGGGLFIYSKSKPLSAPTTVESPEGSKRYQVYTNSSFDAVKGNRRVLYFHADWCPICRHLDKEFQSRASEIPGDVYVFKTNYDREVQLKQKYGVTYQHTFVLVDKNGNAIKKWNGGSFDEVLNMVGS